MGIYVHTALMILAISAVSSHQAHGWGGRGHHTICDAAVFLTQEADLRDYLKAKPHIMGHLCNVPDIYWKSLGGDVVKIGSPTHYLDPEVIGNKAAEIPLNYQELIKKYQGSENRYKGTAKIKSIPSEFGSNWWRADQFFRRAVALKEKFSQAGLPGNSKDEFFDDHPYNKIAFELVTTLGIMGHFVADNAQPFHLTADYDGYKAGHGGIHAYYEDTVVSALGYDLQTRIVKEGQKLLDELKFRVVGKEVQFLIQPTVLEKMRALGALSARDIQKVIELDKLEKPSVVIEEKGMEIKTVAERVPLDKTLKKFEPLVITHMARGAALLAQLWDEAYRQLGKPKLKGAKSYKFPLTPEYVAPDYLE